MSERKLDENGRPDYGAMFHPADRGTDQLPGEPSQAALFDATATAVDIARSLRDDYVVPPFTVLDTRQGYWQERRAAWLALGIKSEEGRTLDGKTSKRSLVTASPTADIGKPISVFDPLLCEIVYRWWCPSGGLVLDPFAGGSVRGILASALGRRYEGVELRAEQVEANREQAGVILGPTQAETPEPRWMAGDSAAVLADGAFPTDFADLVFSCPPYGDLEVYSDDPADLSNMAAGDFSRAYARILELSVQRMKPDAFAVFVVGNYRNRKTSELRDLRGLTITAMRRAGAQFYNDAVLVNSVGSASVRADRIFNGGRKLVPLHQYVLVFAKGDPKQATLAITGGQELEARNTPTSKRTALRWKNKPATTAGWAQDTDGDDALRQS